MHHNHHLVNHHFAERLNKIYDPADAPYQNDTGNYQWQLLEAKCNVCRNVLNLDVIHPNYRWYSHVVKADKDIDCIKSMIVGILRQIFCCKFNAIRKNQVAEGEKPMRQVECCACGKVACLYSLAAKITMHYISIVRSFGKSSTDLPFCYFSCQADNHEETYDYKPKKLFFFFLDQYPNKYDYP
jgi:hypothetical protein